MGSYLQKLQGFLKNKKNKKLRQIKTKKASKSHVAMLVWETKQTQMFIKCFSLVLDNIQ
jgi:hypothetical protein